MPSDSSFHRQFLTSITESKARAFVEILLAVVSLLGFIMAWATREDGTVVFACLLPALAIGVGAVYFHAYGIWKREHAERVALENLLAAANHAEPDARVTLSDTGEWVYLDIRNDGATGEFYTQMLAKGVNNFPAKTVHARWDNNHTDVRIPIARGTTERVRLARREMSSTMMRYDVHWMSDYTVSTSPSTYSSILSDPKTHNWRAELSITVIAIPDLLGGPIAATVFREGNGNVSMIS